MSEDHNQQTSNEYRRLMEEAMLPFIFNGNDNKEFIDEVALTEQINEWEKDLTKQERISIKEDMENGVGVKYDDGKMRLAQIIPPIWIRRLGEVLEYGTIKYSMHNWKGLNPDRLLDAAFRHMLEVNESLQECSNPMCVDKESGLYNIYQAAWNLMAAAYILEKDGNSSNEENNG